VIKAGVVPERIVPGKPQQNGRLEHQSRWFRLDGNRVLPEGPRM
jgi:hypothetical protein